MKKIISLCLIILIAFSLCSCSVFKILKGVFNSKNDTKAETKLNYTMASDEKLKMYSAVDEYAYEMKITKFNELDNVAYVETKEFFDILAEITKEVHNTDKINISYKCEGDNIILTSQSGETITINHEKNSLIISDLFSFYSTSEDRDCELLFDYGDNLHNSDEEVYLVGKGNVDYVVRTKTETVLDLTPYNIDIIEYEGKIYLPFQLMSNLMLSPLYQTYVCFDDGIYLSPQLSYSDGYADFYKSKTMRVTDDLLKYNYYETCFLMDTMFGISKEEYNMSFDDLFIANGLKEKALESVHGYDELLNFLTSRIIDDSHTGIALSSPLDEDYKCISYGQSHRQISNKYLEYSNARLKMLGESPLPYQEIGNTAYITFDAFDEPRFDEGNEYEADYSQMPDNLYDTVHIFAYAYQQITREDSPIENVVVDVSCNGGGDTRTLAYVLGFFIDEAVFCIRDNVDDLIGFCGYKSDCNLDKVIDEKDKLLLDKNIFVIESGYSYSCANIFTNVMEHAGCIMLGECSGGGSCVVQCAISAIGTVYQFSGSLTMMNYKNGVYTTNDDGCPVDYAVTTDKIYDRAFLTEYINTLVN